MHLWRGLQKIVGSKADTCLVFPLMFRLREWNSPLGYNQDFRIEQCSFISLHPFHSNFCFFFLMLSCPYEEKHGFKYCIVIPLMECMLLLGIPDVLSKAGKSKKK